MFISLQNAKPALIKKLKKHNLRYKENFNRTYKDK